MNNDETKYRKMLDVLKKSKPSLSSIHEIEVNVLDLIMQKDKKKKRSVIWLNFIFGWVYVRWVRTALVTASILLIVVFAYQQTIILRSINSLGNRMIYVENQENISTGSESDIAVFYRLSGRKLPSHGITISEKQMDQIINSYNELEGKYRDLVKLIEEDPELRNYIEKKLSEENREKLNL